MIIPNFNITAGNTVSDIFIENGTYTFYDAIRAVHKLPYGRIDNPLDFGNIITEGRGTCSTKHATLKTLTDEHAIYGLQLELVIYAMDNKNTLGIGNILEKYNLPYMLEAHTVLAYDDEVYDYTFAGTHNMSWREAVLMQTTIDTDQIEDFKMEYHKSVLEDWIKRDDLAYSLDDIWNIREQCIEELASVKIL